MRSAVLQLQAGNPQVPAAALCAEAADVLQSLTLERLHGGVLQTDERGGGHFHASTRSCGCTESGALSEGETYSDQDAVQVPGLVPVAVLGVLPQQLRQAPHAGHPEDVDVVIAAESLQQREVDLQRDVVRVLLVGGEKTQNHTVWISAGANRRKPG